ncbi:hypothetical protein FNV43_RR08553 [Rhamnella rubrinervis]|uniref:DNA (cytosine-5-)-methyltransferase n=1 Tax=Rhamnella rubrinervis TaxID=2594499 RepID=A0A8K0MJ67_9ROSA|nr:hypothetical protein FNV43_RR08553 [Rhamnella rubrinervis]
MRPTTKSKSKSGSGTESRALTVLRENAVSVGQPVPLNVYDPRFSGAMGSRSSPRLNPSPVEVKSENVARKRRSAAPEKCPRRSPRLSGSGSGNAETIPSEFADSSAKNQAKKVKRESANRGSRNFDAECLRRSPRFVSSPVIVAENGKSKVQRKSGNRGSRNFDVECMRRSPRFAPPSVVLAENCKSKSDCVKGQKSKGQNLKPGVEEELQSSNVECLQNKCVRRSPRLTLAQTGTASDSSKASVKEISVEKVGSPEIENGSFEPLSSEPVKLTMASLRELDEKPLSIDLTWPEGGDTGPMPLKYCETGFFAKKQVRRSPRFMPAAENGVGEVVKIDMKASDEKFVRSTRCSSSLARNESIRIESIDNFSKLSDSLYGLPSMGILPSLGKSDIKESDQNYLQCSRGATPIFDANKVSEECTLINLVLPKKIKMEDCSKNKQKNGKCSFIGDPIPNHQAQERWRWRYEMKSQISKAQTLKLNDDEEDEVVLDVECHFSQAKINNCIFNIGDCAHIRGDGEQKHIGRIVEFFRTTNGEDYFRVQWFYRVEDTVIKEGGAFHDKRRLFYSTIMNDNLIDCIISKVNVTQLAKVGSKMNSVSPSDYYYDMEYCVDYSTFRSLATDNSIKSCFMASPSGNETMITTGHAYFSNRRPAEECYHSELTLLDLYCGCGGMSTGLCLGAKASNVKLVTRWALDSDRSACESIKLNHPGIHVRNEDAEDFLELLKEWEKLCKRCKVNVVENTHLSRSKTSRVAENEDEILPEEFEVSKIVDICYGDPTKTGKRQLNFKVHWKGYSSSEDTWEPVEGLSYCRETIQEFVRNWMKLKILPLPGDVHVICGGPPCQGISGYNRFRNIESPLEDERNRQIVVFMDIVKFLKPKYVLMENVVDILKFDKGSLGRYALSRLVKMNYQARLGMISAGCYGLPQFRLRVFLWGAHHSENLPQFPLPTHDVVVRYWPPLAFERNTVAYDEDQPRGQLENAVVLQDAISDLPPVTNDESREVMSYLNPPQTEFQRYIRSTKYEMTGFALDDTGKTKVSLYDHRPILLNEDDYLRVCQIPKRKGANFRDLPGVVVGSDNVCRRDPENKVLLPSGKPLVPDFAFTFEQGRSKRPYGRLWWDETVPTVVTAANCHSQVLLHPEQDRVLTIREAARLQGFPDYYRFYGTDKQRYCQVGNAVAVPVARALGYALGLAIRKCSGNEPLMTLPKKFSHSNYFQLVEILSHETD